MKLPVNKELKERARELRKNGTLSEVLLWNQLKSKKALGIDFDRQKIIGNYIVDFYCPQLNMVIEIDGRSHDNKFEYDMNRQNYLEKLGLMLIRFDDIEIKKNMPDVMKRIEGIINYHYPAGYTGTPSPAKGI